MKIQYQDYGTSSVQTLNAALILISPIPATICFLMIPLFLTQ